MFRQKNGFFKADMWCDMSLLNDQYCKYLDTRPDIAPPVMIENDMQYPLH